MLLAVKDNTRARPNKTGERAMCPVCQVEVISKCGEINVWHWAHRASLGCDSWMESDSQWHAEWKALVPEDWIEIVIEKDGKRRLADIRLLNGCVVKLQHGPLSPEQIREYERFFGNMVWIFDVRETTEPSDSFESPRLNFRKKEMSPLAKSLMGVKETPAHYRTSDGNIRESMLVSLLNSAYLILATKECFGWTSCILIAPLVVLALCSKYAISLRGFIHRCDNQGIAFQE